MKIAYQLDVLCRLCLSQVGKENMFRPIDMTNDIFTVTGVKVVPNDPLPQKICIQCIKIIKDAVHLRFVSKKNDKQLKYLLFSETDYNCDGEIHLSLASQQPQVISRSTHEQNTLNNAHTANYSEPSNSNDDSNTSNQILKVREDLYNQSMIENNHESSTQDNNGDISAIVNKDDKEVSGDDQSLLVPVKQQRLSDPEEDQLFSYECEKCFKVFDSRKKLTLHARIHKKKCRCPHDGCEKIFACNNDLYKHIRCHTGEKPYQCDICLRSFTQNGTLRSHKISIHGIVPQSRGARFKFEYGMPSDNVQCYDSIDMPVASLEDYYDSKFLVTSTAYKECMSKESDQELPLQVELSTKDSQATPQSNGQEQHNILSSVKIRLSPEDGSKEVNQPIESFYEPELSGSSTPKPTTSVPS